jgi:hypothetical protein
MAGLYIQMQEKTKTLFPKFFCNSVTGSKALKIAYLEKSNSPPLKSAKMETLWPFF